MLATKCPPRKHLEAYAKGCLPDDEIESVTDHLEACGDCENTVALFDDESDTFIEQIREPIEHAEFADEPDFQRAVAKIESIDDEPVASEPSGQLRDYKLLEKLGEGGMGTVYRALHNKLQRVVALKILPAHRRDSSSISRFSREIEAVGKLDHPNIVRAFDAGEDNDMHYLVMELVEGIDLHRLTKDQGPLSVANACEIVRQAALGLQHAHQHGLVHRDIKPSNLMLVEGRASKTEGKKALDPSLSSLDSRASVKILDLGLALLQSDEQRHEMTNTGQVMGTLDYMAPEQASDSHTVDLRADIYSLGCTLFKLLTGRSPFSGPEYDTPVKKVMAHAKNTPPSLADDRDDVPVELSDFVARMLAKDPNERPSSAEEISAALKPFCEDSDLSALASDACFQTGHDGRIASANEIPVMLKGGGFDHRCFEPEIDWRGQFFIWLGTLSMAAALAMLVMTIAGMTKAYRLNQRGLVDVSSMIPESLVWLRYGAPAFLIGLVLLIVGRREMSRQSIYEDARLSTGPGSLGVFLSAISAILLLTTGVLAVILLNTAHGQLVIDGNGEDVKVQVHRDGQVVEIIDTKENKTVKLTVGEYGLRLIGKDGFELDTQSVAIRRGEKVIATVRLSKVGEDLDLPRHKGEVTFAGKTLEYWAAQLNDRDPSFRQKAVEAVVSFGEAGVDPLIKMLGDKDSHARYQAAHGLARLAPKGKQAIKPMIKLLSDPADWTHTQALTCLAKFRREAKSAEDAVFESFTSDERPKLRSLAAWCLWFIEADQKRMREPLLKMLQSNSAADRRAAAYILAQDKTNAKTVVPALTDSLIDDIPGSLGLAAPNPQTLADDLLLGSELERIQKNNATTIILESLVSYGDLADPSIRRLAAHDDFGVKSIALRALMMRETPDSLRQIVEMFPDKNDKPHLLSHSVTSTLYLFASKSTPKFLQCGRVCNQKTRDEIVKAMMTRFVNNGRYSDPNFKEKTVLEHVLKDPKLIIEDLERSITRDRFSRNRAVAAAALLALINSDASKAVLEDLAASDSTQVSEVVESVLAELEKPLIAEPHPEAPINGDAKLQRRLEQATATVKAALAEAAKVEPTNKRRAVELLMPAFGEAEILFEFEFEGGEALYVKVDDELKRLDPTREIQYLITSERTAAEIKRSVADDLLDLLRRNESTDRKLTRFSSDMQRYQALAKERVPDKVVKREVDTFLAEASRKVHSSVTWIKENPVIIESFNLPDDERELLDSGPTDLNYWPGGMAILNRQSFKRGTPTKVWVGVDAAKDDDKPGRNEILTWSNRVDVLSSDNPKLLYTRDRMTIPGSIKQHNEEFLQLAMMDIPKDRGKIEGNILNIPLKEPRGEKGYDAQLHAQTSIRVDTEHSRSSIFLRIPVPKEGDEDRWKLIHIGRDDEKKWNERPNLVADMVRWPSKILQPPATSMTGSHTVCFAMDEQYSPILFRTRDKGQTWNAERVVLADNVKDVVKRIPLAMWDRGFFELIYATVSEDDGNVKQLFKARSYDEGRSWTDILPVTEPFKCAEEWLYAVRAASAGNESVVICPPSDLSESVRLLATVDEGKNWQEISLKNQFAGQLGLTAVKMRGDKILIAGHVLSMDTKKAQLVFQQISMGPLKLED